MLVSEREREIYLIATPSNNSFVDLDPCVIQFMETCIVFFLLIFLISFLKMKRKKKHLIDYILLKLWSPTMLFQPLSPKDGVFFLLLFHSSFPFLLGSILSFAHVQYYYSGNPSQSFFCKGLSFHLFSIGTVKFYSYNNLWHIHFFKKNTNFLYSFI